MLMLLICDSLLQPSDLRVRGPVCGLPRSRCERFLLFEAIWLTRRAGAGDPGR